MIADTQPVLEGFDPVQASGAEALWVERDLSADQFEVHDQRILLVEDREPLRASMRMMLELDGHQVTEASNGAEALNLFTPGEFDLVITDFEMPIMNGDELAEGIKLLAPSLPILMITASERARAGAGDPVDTLLNKPVRVADLRGALAELFSRLP